MKKPIVLFTFSLILLLIGFTTTAASNIIKLPFKPNYNTMSVEDKKQIDCLAENIYFEAGYEPEKGQIAVAFVTINRVKSGFFEKDICGVVKQKTKNVCQFSWYCEEKPKAIAYSKALTNGHNLVYNDIINLAAYVYVNHDSMEDPSKGALFYHADYVRPGWKNMEHLTTIGRHIFYIRKDLKWTS